MMETKNIKKMLRNTAFLIVTLSVTLVLLTPFAATLDLANGIVMGKVFWANLAIAFMALGCLFCILTTDDAALFSINITDMALIGLLIVSLASYDYSLNPAPEKILFGCQMIMLWVMLRFILTRYPMMKQYILVVVMLSGLAEAVTGIRQLYGYEQSYHSMFKITGSFFNPGPYAGYMSVIMPICLGTAKREKMKLTNLGWITLVVIVIVLPATMSRTAWITGLASCSYVWWKLSNVTKRFKNLIIEHRKIMFLCIVGVIAMILATAIGLYYLKKKSADGRLLMWKVTMIAMNQNPIKGVGIGGFPEAFANAQAQYLSSSTATDNEKFVAGCPEYAFNEFLQIGLEQGIIGLIFFILFLYSAFWRALRTESIGAAGGIMALSVFAFASYPLQLPSFWILMIAIAAIAVTTQQAVRKRKRITILSEKVTVFIVVSVSCTLFCIQKERYKAYKDWQKLQLLYRNKAYRAAIDDYTRLHRLINHRADFLFEEAQCLSKAKLYPKAIEVLQRAKRLSADPMIRYMLAKNMQIQGLYEEAERELLKAIEVLPERIYPYYLLAKLYAEPSFINKKKLAKAATAVKIKEPKVNSTAILEMRKEIELILKEQ